MRNMSTRTATFRLADILLEGGFEAFVNSRREANVSWRRVALDLRDATDRQIDVEPSTLRSWFVATEAPAEKSA